MQSFGEYLETINISLGSVLYLGSLLLAVAAIFGGLVGLLIGCERITSRWGAWWNLLYVPAVVVAAAFVAIFASWVGIEVSPHV